MSSSTSTSNSTSTSTLSGHPPPRMPHDSPKNLGSDMTMSFFDEQLIKSLNVEALGRAFLPPPPYMTLPEYSVLRPEGYRSPDPLPIYFSLNLSVYNQQIVDSEWQNQWFHFTGKVHPYALEWVLREPDVFTDEDGDGEVYKVPVVLIRDFGYQALDPRTLCNSEGFPLIQPVVSLTGQVLGTGQTHLIKDSVPMLDDAQLRCCAFIQCCTYITPGQLSKSPFKGFHPFQVFILFPIRALPFSLLCKKMADRKDTQFVPVGLLDHRLMATAPPVDEKDYSTPPAPAANTVSPSKTEPGPSQAGGFAAARSMFKSPSKKSSQVQQSRSQSSQSPQRGPSQQPVTPSQNKRPAISASPSSQSSSNNPAPKRLRGSTVTTETSPIIAGSPVSPLTSVDSDENDNHEEGEAKENEDSPSPNISATLRSSVRPNMRSSTTEPGGKNKRHPTKRL
ncbi:hypothetical protein EDB81DRAFT_922145 [Dactylonectria macrodidyma]|uniref:Uncharacterized protein n=1 Tax=Dactylonectria macrodidyma TaxID=307937 RepID=A0A9P9IB29_9HYPO|nr:hypothetical protein EDB81DRAFT_922145 [Dactylonectria macrodidyma]